MPEKTWEPFTKEDEEAMVLAVMPPAGEGVNEDELIARVQRLGDWARTVLINSGLWELIRIGHLNVSWQADGEMLFTKVPEKVVPHAR